MPIPWLAIVGIGAAVKGIKSGFDAHRDNSEAQSMTGEAWRTYEHAEVALKAAREKTSNTLADLGRTKIEIWDRQFGRFAEAFESLKNVRIEGQAASEDFGFLRVTEHDLAEMKDLSLQAREIVAGGVAALGAGALAGIASYGGTMMFAAASTGTAISTLTGVAATNATLAWLGGGSLAAGGLGMAGGIAVLGGMIAGPVLAVGGIMMAWKARENLAVAQTNLAEAKKAAKQMQVAKTVLDSIDTIAKQFGEGVKKLDERMTRSTGMLEGLIRDSGNDYSLFTRFEKQVVQDAVLYAQAMKVLLETPILTAEGGLSPNCSIMLQRVERMIPVS